MLSITAGVMLLVGWLLPWFLSPISGGIGFSAQDAVVSSPTGAGTVLIYVLPLMFHNAPDFVLWAAQDLAIYMLLALGLNVVVGFAGLLDLGYAAFFAIGAYVCASLASPAHHLHLPLWALLFIGAMVAALFG